MKQAALSFILLHKIDLSRNMARFYIMSVQPTLFGGGSLVRNWGRIGTRGRAMIELFDDLAEADVAMSRHAKAKCNRGYNRERAAAPPANRSSTARDRGDRI